MVVARVHAFISFKDGGTFYPAAVVSWYRRQHAIPDPTTGMWSLLPEYRPGGNEVSYEVIHTDCIVRACHLIPDFGAALLPGDLNYSHALDAFNRYNLSKYADYHTFECYPT